MKYMIETTAKGCKETLKLNDNTLGPLILTAEHVRTDSGSKCITKTLDQQMRDLGYSEEIVDVSDTVLDAMHAYEFMRLDEYLSCS